MCSPSYFCYHLRKGVVKKNCLNCPGWGPASRALTLKGSSYLYGASEGSNASAGRRTPAGSHRSLRLPALKARGRESDFSRAGPQRCRPCPSSPWAWSDGCPCIVLSSWGVPFPQPHRQKESCSTRAQQLGPVPPSLHPRTREASEQHLQPLTRRMEGEGRREQMGCSKGGQRQSEELLFPSTPEMMFYWSSQT